ncbi:MAG: hypothetical protein ACRES5_34265 [Pseudomonas sp.]
MTSILNPTPIVTACITQLGLDLAGEIRVDLFAGGGGETAYESRYLAEGINRIHHGDGDYAYHALNTDPMPGNWSWPEDAFKDLWNSINGTGAWDSNPWVWVGEFKRVTPLRLGETA